MWIYTNLTPNTYKILAPGQFLSKLFSYRCLKITCLHIECPQTGQWSLQVFISSATQETSGLTNQVTTFLAVHIYLHPWESPMILLMAAGLCLVRFHWREGFFSARIIICLSPGVCQLERSESPLILEDSLKWKSVRMTMCAVLVLEGGSLQLKLELKPGRSEKWTLVGIWVWKAENLLEGKGVYLKVLWKDNVSFERQ